MNYMGSKLRHAKDFIPLMVMGHSYIEPFVGGCGSFYQVEHANKIGLDNNYELIEFWKALQGGWLPPTEVSYDHYYEVKADENHEKFTPAYRGFVKFACSFGGKEWGGFARDKKGVEDPELFPRRAANASLEKLHGTRNYTQEAVSLSNKKLGGLQSAVFIAGNYTDYPITRGYTVYCDPPYAGTTKYKTGAFDHAAFWEWVRAKSELNYVYVSEYAVPDDFKVLWAKGVKANLVRDGKYPDRTELFGTIRGGLADRVATAKEAVHA